MPSATPSGLSENRGCTMLMSLNQLTGTRSTRLKLIEVEVDYCNIVVVT